MNKANAERSAASLNAGVKGPRENEKLKPSDGYDYHTVYKATYEIPTNTLTLRRSYTFASSVDRDAFTIYVASLGGERKSMNIDHVFQTVSSAKKDLSEEIVKFTEAS